MVTSCFLLIASLLLQLTKSTLPCDGVQYTDSDGWTRTEAAGICSSPSVIGSSMKICDPDDTSVIYVSTWDYVTDCSGDPSRTEIWSGMNEYSNVEVTCCSGKHGGKACQYALRSYSSPSWSLCPVNSWTTTYIIDTCSKYNDRTPSMPAYYTSCTNNSLSYKYWSSDLFTCGDDVDVLATNSTTSKNGYCIDSYITCHTAENTCVAVVDENNIIAYLAWIAWGVLLVIYGGYKGYVYIRSKCDKKSQVDDPQLSAKLITVNSKGKAQNVNVNVDDDADKVKIHKEQEFVDAFKPSVISSFSDVKSIINSCVFMLYFYDNTGYDLDSPVGNFQIFLFILEVLFQIIDLFVCVIWYFDLSINVGKNINIGVNRRLIVNYYKFKLVQINFGFLEVLFKLYYTFDYLDQNITFYNMVFALTMVFKSYWMLIFDFMAKAQGQEKGKGIKGKILDKVQDGLVQLVIIIPLFYMVNAIVLGLEVIDNRWFLLIYCMIWFIAPWAYYICMKLDKYIKACDCGHCMTLFCGISQCFMTTAMFILSIIGGLFVTVPSLQWLITLTIYGASGLVVSLTCIGQYMKGGSWEHEKALRWCCLIYMLPFIIAIGFYSFDAIINDETAGDEYDNDYNNENEYENEHEYEPIEPIG